jgi:hypothetical protein
MVLSQDRDLFFFIACKTIMYLVGVYYILSKVFATSP